VDAAGKPVGAKSLDRAKLTQTSFQRESINISPPQLIKIRQLFSAVGVPSQPKEEQAKVPALLARLREPAGKAGRVAPAPQTPKLDMIVRHAAVQLLKPNVVHVTIPRRTLNDETELQDWLAEVEALLIQKLKAGPVAL
jgi:hypothetical protein